MKLNKKLFILPFVMVLILTASITGSPLGGVGKALATTTLGNALNGDILSGKTATTDSGPITGTITNRSGSFNQTTWSNGNADAGVDYVVPAGYYDGNTQIWAADGNLNSANIKAGTSIFGVPGKSSVVDTGDANASAAQIVNGYTAYINGNKVTGTIPNWSNGGRPAATGLWTGGGSSIYLQLPQGYTNGNDTWVSASEPNLVPANIISGKTICGVTGTGPSHSSQQWTTPGTYQWTVPDGINYMLVEVAGGGGGGGGGYTSHDYYFDSGGGGGGGGTNITTVAVTPGQVLTIVVGGAGPAGTDGCYHGSGGNYGPNATNGGDGGISSIAGVGAGGGKGGTAGYDGGCGYGGTGGSGGGFGSYGGNGTNGRLGTYGQGGSGAMGNSGGHGGYGIGGSPSCAGGYPGEVVVQY